jgi:hypothetical protein
MKKGENGSVGLLRLLDSLGFHRSSRRMANFKSVKALGILPCRAKPSARCPAKSRPL